MKLPNHTQAVVEIAKLRDYCLNPEHIRGQHKARVFASALNMTANEAEMLKDLLLAAAKTENAVQTTQDEYGERFIIDFEVEHKDKKALVRSTWIIRESEDFPRLTSCYVL